MPELTVASLLRPELALLLALAGCAVPDRSVTRVVDGREVRGRFVSARAYAAYTQGAYLEARGDAAGAQAAYQQALEADPSSVHLHTRLGAVLCPTDEPQAREHFDQAAGLDATYELLWRERARCHLRHGRIGEARRAVQRALAYDPLQIETNLLASSIQLSAGERELALQTLEALVTRFPDSREAWRALRALSRRLGNAVTRDRAGRELTRLARPGSALPSTDPSPGPALGELDAELHELELRQARRRASAAGLSPGELALRAAALGLAELARRQAELVLQADPDDADAWIAGLLAADLGSDEADFMHALSLLGARRGPPSSLGARLLAELLRRRLGEAAAAAWLEAYGPLPATADPLERSVADR